MVASAVCHSHPAALGLHSGQKGKGAKNSPQSRKTNQRTKFQKNKGGTQKSLPPEDLRTLSAQPPRPEAISFRLFQEQWVSRGWLARAAVRQGVDLGPGRAAPAHPRAGRAGREPGPAVPGRPGRLRESWAASCRKEWKVSHSCWPDAEPARPHGEAIWRDASKAFDPERLIPETGS